MATSERSIPKIDVDQDGYLVRPEDWTEAIAGYLAAHEGIAGLTKEQFDILRSLRSYYQEHRFFPILRAVCRSVHQPRTCVTDKFNDPVTAWKIAGLPNPGEEVNQFRSWNPLGY